MGNRWSLRQKLVSAFASSAVMLGVVGAIGYVTSHNETSHYRRITDLDLPSLSAVNEMRVYGRRAEIAVLQAGLGDATPEQIGEAQKHFEEALKSYEEADAAYRASPVLPGEEALYVKVSDQWKVTRTTATRLMGMLDDQRPEAKQKFFRMLRAEYVPEAAQHVAKLRELTAFHKADVKESVQEAVSTERRGEIITLVAIVIGFFTAVTTGWFFSQSLSRSLDAIATRLEGGAARVAQESGDISNFGAELSKNATHQASALQETVASIDEINAMVGKNAENAGNSQEVSKQSQQAAQRGQATVKNMIDAIDDVNRSNEEIMSQIEESNREVSKIVQVIAEIGKKTEVINEIVFQTKLLSFNASVEAARAGEHGKGFAVVAQEVGNLAQMSGNAAREISQLLQASTLTVERTVEQTRSRVESLMVAGREKVHTGQTTAQECGRVLDEIVQNVASVNEMIREIAVASQEQSLGVKEITKAMQQLDQTTQQNAGSSRESAQAAIRLTSEAQDLNTMVIDLGNIVHGGQGVTTRTEVVEMKNAAPGGHPQIKPVSVGVRSQNSRAA